VFRAFTEFDGLRLMSFSMRAQFLSSFQVPCVYQFHHPGSGPDTTLIDNMAISHIGPLDLDVPATIRGRQCVAVRTKQPNIAQLIVFAISIDVIKLERDLPPEPLG